MKTFCFHKHLVKKLIRKVVNEISMVKEICPPWLHRTSDIRNWAVKFVML
jgi:hypothetical protein